MNELKVVENQNVVFALASAAQTIYAGRKSGVFRSSDAGKTWQNTFDEQFQGIAATALATHHQTVFAGVKGAVVRSQDGGETWDAAVLSSPAPLVVDIAVSPQYNQDQFVVAATAEDGVFVSNDRGLNWNAWNFGLVDLHCNCIAISPDQMIYVGTESGIFRSHNRGKTWHEMPFPMEAAPVLSLCISSTHIWAGTAAAGLYVSDRKGQTWAKTALPEISDESISSLLLTTNGVMVLTDHHLLLLEIQSDDFACRKFHVFRDRQALSLAQMNEQYVIGFTDGEIQIADIPVFDRGRCSPTQFSRPGKVTL